ncbi:MAG: DUF3348 family protein [Parahaliea sp.]
MIRTPPASTLTQSRLASQLARIAAPVTQQPPGQFAERLGRLIDLSSSVSLSVTLAGLKRCPFEAIPGGVRRAREDFIKVHGAMVAAIMRSLVPGSGPSRIKWPRSPEEGGQAAAESYGKFYSAHQREMDARVRGLQERVRDNLSGISPMLAELAQLDAALSDALAVDSRRLLASIPVQVIARVQALRASAIDDESIEQQLQADLQGLLLAEAEVRLLPAQGLVEAAAEQAGAQAPVASSGAH